MAGIPLRIYLKDIERMIESGRLEEAVAHCRYILQTYPKYVDVYRLLGKAYLENQRYGDAADVFQRVLSAIPDDFISNVGMSIIREDEGNLDEAIWHMDRAFEVQPSNGAIQEELRRLYQRRDEIQPTRIRLTRGALARTYIKDDNIQQAIPELRAALAEDPNRLDLQTLLAKLYANLGKRADAAELASAVLRKLPYSLEANRVMVEVLTASQREEETKAFIQRLAALEPYSAYISREHPNPADVPEQAITIEKLDYKGSQIPGLETEKPAWAASLGINLGEGGGLEKTPEWMKEIEAEPPKEEPKAEQPFKEPSTPAFISEDEKIPEAPLPDWLSQEAPISTSPAPESQLPEWMAAAGWEPSTGTAKEEEILPVEEEKSSIESDEELAAAEIPEWLRAMAPTEIEESQPESEDISEWLSKIIPPTSEGDLEEPRIEAPQPPLSEGEPAPEIEVPEWLFESEIPEGAAEEIGEKAPQPPFEEPTLEASFAEELPGKIIQPEEIEKEAEFPTEATPSAVGLPSWLLESEETTISEEALPSAEETEAAAPKEILPKEELPEWLLEIETTPTPERILGTEEPEGVPSEAAVSEAEIPEWLKEFKETPQVEAFEPTAVERMEVAGEIAEAETPAEEMPVTEIPEWLLETEETPGFMEEMIPEMKEGAEPSLEKPMGQEELPEWLLESQELIGVSELEEAPIHEGDTKPHRVSQPVSAEAEPPVIPTQEAPKEEKPFLHFAEIIGEPLAPEPTLPKATIEEIPTQPPEEALLEAPAEAFLETPLETTPQETVEGMPETALGLAEEQILEGIGESLPEKAAEPTAPVAEKPQGEDIDAAFAWLESLAVKQGADEALLLKPEERLETPPEWVVQEMVEEGKPEAELPAEELPIEVIPSEILGAEIKAPSIQITETFPEQEVSGIGEEILQVSLAEPEVTETLPTEEEISEIQPSVPEFLEVPQAEVEILEAPQPELEISEGIPTEAEVTEAPIIEEEIPEVLQPELETFEVLPTEAEILEALQPKAEGVEAPQIEQEETVAPKIETVEAQAVVEKAVEEVPELPDWLAGPPPEPTEVLEWRPPQVEPIRRFDLNQASLVELERLPGVGFILAQRILEYRENKGAFNSLDDLLLVPGFSEVTLESIRDHLFIETVPEREIAPLPTPEPAEPVILEEAEAPPELVEIRQVLNRGEVDKALERYASMVKNKQHLAYVIKDLEKAAERYPKRFELWQTLGDAYLRSDQVKEALQAFIKAEELLI